jgi:hypothetical protein
MEGDLLVQPGDTLKAGYDFTMPGSHPAATVMVSNAQVQPTVVCPDGANQVLTVPLPTQTYQIATNNSDWLPPGNQSSSLVYQGSIVVPNTLCGGQARHAPSSATFTATFTSTDSHDRVNVRFRYSDNTAGRWSVTAHVVP